MVASYVGENKEFERQFLAGELEVELNPQGTLAERIRAAGCGIGGFFTPTGVGTKIAEGKETRIIDGQGVRAREAAQGRLRHRPGLEGGHVGQPASSARRPATSPPLMCMAAKITIVEVEQLVRGGRAGPRPDPRPQHLRAADAPGRGYQKWIEKRTVRKRA